MCNVSKQQTNYNFSQSQLKKKSQYKMMLHDHLLSTQLIRGVKNDCNGLLQSSPTLHRLHAPPMNMDLYSAYAFQAHFHQQQQQEHLRQVPEVLDLSRRCDSVETTRKTPSPYQTNSSTAGTPPILSPKQTAPAENLYGNAHPALYPILHYPQNVAAAAEKPVAIKTEATSAPPTNTLLQTFAVAAAAAAVNTTSALNNDTQVAPDSSKTVGKIVNNTDMKTTRPFKAFPRDPLVIAANFAATDVLLDNPRVERYTEYRKRVLEQIRNSNGGTRTITNPKMRRTSNRSGCITEGVLPAYKSNSENECTVEESSDCDSNAGNFERMSTSLASSTSSIDLQDNNNNKGNNNDNNNNSTTSRNNCENGTTIKDAAYYERRRKNNAAAKKSRDRRRIKEDEIAIRAAYLERQNIELLCQIDALKAQLATLTSKVNL